MNLLLLVALIVAFVVAAALGVRAIGGNITLVEDWKKAWRWYSTYGLILLAAMPDIFNALLAGDYLAGTPVSEEFSWWIRIGAGATFLLRSLNQLKRPDLPKFDSTDGAGA
ncbi:hypothetical protein [Pseudoxanthomonas indica]|uniref:Uncharacterized protein n=1 Tax=Pseudoxanthomonas indica TaxID=428993 RepID=A0A1T5K140_9GAMM|nr:hypothetical protein [Pseudoxanthomonas indica]GGD45750.1 hypothetical protein GCM10007235_17120 [Pseudoxanthomonas indica]SKC57199.1 hypothetical protein SAMN06296058_1253 [Pseudoxanthomonas indica]